MGNLSNQTLAKLTEARLVIEELEDMAVRQANSGSLPAAVETVERDVAGASKKFLRDTRDEKLEPKEKKHSKGPSPKIENGWVTLRFRITLEQRDIIAAAMERAREIQGLQGSLWKGVALEWVAADFLAGNGWPSDMSGCQDAAQAKSRLKTHGAAAVRGGSAEQDNDNDSDTGR